MLSIALFCEGASEVKILTHIITRYLGDDVSVNPIQPEMVTNHGYERQGTYGGWQGVLNHCNDDAIKRALSTNDYLVIQIDTDRCHEDHYDVNRYDENHVEVTDEELYGRIVMRLFQDVSEDVRCEYGQRILFAICFNETECWLLPIFYESSSPKECAATNNCIFRLNKKLSKDGFGIPDKEKNIPAAIKVYQKILKDLKRKDIPRISQYNYGFKMFVEQMDSIKEQMGLSVKSES